MANVPSGIKLEDAILDITFPKIVADKVGKGLKSIFRNLGQTVINTKKALSNIANVLNTHGSKYALTFLKGLMANSYPGSFFFIDIQSDTHKVTTFVLFSNNVVTLINFADELPRKVQLQNIREVRIKLKETLLFHQFDIEAVKFRQINILLNHKEENGKKIGITKKISPY